MMMRLDERLDKFFHKKPYVSIQKWHAPFEDDIFPLENDMLPLENDMFPINNDMFLF